MHGNKISGRLPTSLMKLTRLRVLQLSKNELVGGIPKWFGKELPSLKVLNLRSNNFDGNIPGELCYLIHIQILDLADNNLSGNIPKCFNNFHVLSGKETASKDPFAFSHVAYTRKVLNSDTLVMKGRADTYSTILSLVVILDLLSNSFVGDIPSELTALEALQSLNLSRNQLTGRIPGNIRDMKALVSCDLSVNKLYEELPMSLSSLTLLSSFNVSYNSLTGRVPSSTQLQSLNESSFIGNKLCGAPLTERCTVEVPATQDQKEDHVSHKENWGLVISIVLGFVSGFWVVFAPLLVSRSWRITYFHYARELGYKVYDVINKYCCNIFCKR
ncbi:leucine-rich repeat protein [Tanacetum coccineum]